ncbi:SDR family NAD(P)-dependent oxidoreductase [Mariniluteicoccus flavus]
MDITGKVFVVTGGANGIGREAVLEMLARGARVAAVDVRDDSLAALQATAAAGDRLSVHAVDLTDRRQVATLPEAVVAAHGQVDGLLNVAGIIQRFVTFDHLDYPEIEKVLAVNLWGVLTTCKEFLPLLKDRPQACIVNVSSMGGFTPVPGQTIYGASKAAVKLFTEGLYAELRGSNVAVSVVFPGAIGTDIAKNSGSNIDMPAEAGAAPPMTSPRDAGVQLVKVVERGPYHATIGKDARALDVLSRLAPRRATDLIAERMKSLLQSR